MKKKQPVYKRLDTVPVLFTDQSEYSPQIFDITDYPSRLTAGKNILRFRGNSANLAQNAPLDIEILDYNGEPIYHEVTNYIAEDKSRVVVIYIYPDTSPGPATLTLLTEVQFVNGQQVPTEWSGTFNVRWTRTIYVNPTLINESEIIFEELPTIEIEEQVGVQLNRNYSISQFPTYNTGTVKYVSLNNTPTLIIQGGAFSASMVGGTVTVNTPTNPIPSPRFTVPTIPYSSTIKKVLNTASILLDTEYVIAASQSIFPHTYTKFDSSTYQITYEQTPTYTETQNSESYAIIKINNLQPLTGDISRIKTYINNTGTVGTWEQISDIELDETEIFVTNTSSITPDNRIGTISNQSKINTYYTSSNFSNKSLLGTASLTYDTNILNNSMRITGSGDVTIVQIKNNFAGSFVKDAEYKITLDAVAQKIGTSASMSIYLSGSAFNLDVTDKYNNEFPVRLGKRVGQLQLNTNEITKRYDDQTFSFTANETGTGVLIFVIEGGYWYISDVRTTSDNDAGYTPNYTRIRALVPTAHKSDVQLDFKIEYYNSAGVKCKQENYVKAVAWEGGNRYVDGDYSMLTGSLYVADSLESGIAISGYSDSGFIRSLGYDGFVAGNSGFLLWSGSALTGQLTKYNNPYAGVGLEMYVNANNYFRYSTSDNELDIHTQTFFLGSSTSYISGSNGNIQISGSNIGINTENFFLGNSTNFISGSNGNIKISGSNVSVATPNFFLGDNNNFVSGSNGNIQISGSNVDIETPNFFLGDTNTFISGSNGNLQISSSNFRISPQGGVTASAALLRDSTQSDMFVYRLRDAYTSSYIAAGQTTAGTSTYEADGNPYVSINLTGSRGVSALVNGPGPAAFVRVLGHPNSTDTVVVGRICIHPDDYYTIIPPAATNNKWQQFGSSIMLEAGHEFYLNVGNYGIIGGDYDDSAIAVNDDDWIYPAIQSYTINTEFTGNVPITYSNLIKVDVGTQILLVQSKFAWRIVAMSSYTNCTVGFYDGIQISRGNINLTGSLNVSGSVARINLTGSLSVSGSLQLQSLPITNPGGSGIVWNDGGTLKIT